ncbi:LysR family transcriptional regulator [Clostridium polynesiense]|uniref:LysR family transcriptional regulator n=1 Tax=Clostridium polynesiense TaxID=1325933 RepID=UPI00058E9199|nr:LysR family transcriptional regulator [Clostridium polynesiense]
MDIKQLNFFTAVIEEGNITAAAKKLHIAQPALSNQIKLLEKELGVKLIERGSRKVTLTDAGKILLDKAKHILELERSVYKELGDFNKGLKGTLRIGAISAIDSALLNGRLNSYSKSYPHIKYELHEGITPQIIELIYSGIIEIGIVRTPFKSEGLNVRYLEAEPMIAAYSSEFLLGNDNEKITLEELRDKPLIIYRRFEKLIIATCESFGFEPNVFCINDDSRTTLLWADSGLGIAIVPISSLHLIMGQNLKFKVIDEPHLSTQIAIVSEKGRVLSKAAENFLNMFP